MLRGVARRSPLIAFALGAMSAAAACQIVIGYEEKVLDPSAEGGVVGPGGEEGGVVGPGGGGVDGSTEDVAPGQCPTTTKGPRMVPVPLPTGGTMCIDETEVTQAQYRELTSLVTVPYDQPPECAWNTTIEPLDVCLERLDDGDASPYHCSAATKACDDAPQTCVDWCDAYFYCKWAGKRLCGRTTGGPVGAAEGKNPAVSQWLNACSSGGKNAFPYGANFDGTKCYSTADAGYPTLPVKSFPGCETPEGVFDLSGSVAEWEDSCASADGGDDICVYRGGSFLTDPSSELFECSRQQGRQRGLAAKWRGFRCCWP